MVITIGGWIGLLIGFAVGGFIGMLIGVVVADNYWHKKAEKTWMDRNSKYEAPYEIDNDN